MFMKVMYLDDSRPSLSLVAREAVVPAQNASPSACGGITPTELSCTANRTYP
jgi:hypothetical protein